MAGFGFSETMSGTWEPADRDGPARRFRFTVNVRTGPMGRFRRDHTARMDGRVEAEGLAADTELTGTVIIRPLFARIIRYEFTFDGYDGRPYRFAGQKDIRWLHAVRTWTELPGEITDGDGHLVGRAMTYFDLRTTVPFLMSFRPA